MAKDNKIKPLSLTKLRKDVIRLNKISKDLLDSATNSDTTKRDNILNRYMEEIDDIISTDFRKMTAYSSDDISMFLLDFLKGKGTDNNPGDFNLKSIEDVFENDSTGLLQQFQTKFQSELMLLEDLNDITSQFNELQEAIDITRDSILNADSNNNSISRELIFKTSGEAGTDSSSHVHTAETVEKDFKLLKKIKSHIVPNALKFGKYYVYTVPYEYVYTKFYKNKNKDGVVTESAISSKIEAITESFISDFADNNGINLKKMSSKEKKDVIEAANEFIEAVTVVNDDVSIPILENAQEVAALMDIETSKKIKTSSNKLKATSDGVVDVDDLSKVDADFSNVKGCYMKLIDPRKIIPVRILEQTVGYYYIHDEPSTKNRSPFSSNFRIDLTKGYSKKEDDFIDKLAEKIVKSFDKPFLEKNIKFKKSIAAAIIHNDIYKKNIKFQFIPAEHITEFKVNENEDDDGTSILMGSLFYAKLYLALLLFNMITILSKSNDQRLYYIHSSGIDKNIANKIQSAARQIKSREMNYSDLFNYKSMVSKVGAGRDAYIPVGTGDTRGISFDILAGQDVELYNELMTMLKTSAINSTGVPSVIMNYVNEADYAKSIVMGNLRFLARVMSLQVDFNDSITELYKKIFKYNGSFEEEVINNFSFKLAKPRSLDATNMVELVNNSTALAEFIVNTLAGENSDVDELDNKAKDITTKKILKQITSMLGWSAFEEIYEESVLEAKEILEERKARSNETA